MPTATFAIVSDLHCRLATDARDSFLTVGGLRNPSGRHPVQALIDLIGRENLRADALLVPGDLTNKARREGLGQAWDYSLEIGHYLKATSVIPVIGNHDVDSHRTNPEQHAFHEVRNLRPGFPFAQNADVQSFLADGYCVLVVGDTEIIAVNTVVDHVDPVSAKRGAFSIDRIDRMEAALTGRLIRPLRGALMHHHPILHTGTFLSDADVIPTGDALLNSLRRLGCRFVIHGHKHFSRLSYVDGVAVFASGSFSALLQEFGTAVANTFHTVTIEGDGPADVRGMIHTWAFRYGSGWQRSNAELLGFPFCSGFGHRATLQEIIGAFETLAGTDPNQNRFLEPNVLAAVPDAEYLTPAERDQINQSLGQSDLKMSDHDDGRIELWRTYRP